jgi:FkbM family methyltransferase
MPEEKSPSRELILNGKKRTIYGSSADDLYFSTLCDEGEWPFNHFCQRYIRDDFNCVDIGANIGLMTLYVSEYCTSGRIISVEPNRAVFRALENTIKANGIKNASAVNAAIDEQDGEVRFAEDSAYGHIDSKGGALVEAMTFATLLERYKIDRVDFIKIDVEGHEPVIVRTALDLIKRDKPLIFVEFNSFSLVMSNMKPLGFLEWLLETFAFVYAVTYRSPGSELLTRVTFENRKMFIQDNMLKHGCVDDLVVTDDAGKLTYVREVQPDPRELQAGTSLRGSVLTAAGALLKKVSSLVRKG